MEGCLALLFSVAWCWSTVEHLMKGSFVWCEYVSKKTSLCYVNNMVEHTAREGASLGKLERAELQLTKRFFSLFALEKAVACFLLFAYYLGGRLV